MEAVGSVLLKSTMKEEPKNKNNENYGQISLGITVEITQEEGVLNYFSLSSLTKRQFFFFSDDKPNFRPIETVFDDRSELKSEKDLSSEQLLLNNRGIAPKKFPPYQPSSKISKNDSRELSPNKNIPVESRNDMKDWNDLKARIDQNDRSDLKDLKDRNNLNDLKVRNDLKETPRNALEIYLKGAMNFSAIEANEQESRQNYEFHSAKKKKYFIIGTSRSVLKKKWKYKSFIPDFSDQEARAHWAAIPNASRVAQCEICANWFSNKYALKMHTKVHRFWENDELQCKICGCRFTGSSLINHHLIAHEIDFEIERPFVCETCGTRFGSFAGKKSHECIQHLV